MRIAMAYDSWRYRSHSVGDPKVVVGHTATTYASTTAASYSASHTAGGAESRGG